MPEAAASVLSIRESPQTHSESPQTHFPRRERFGKTPDSVANDSRLSLESKAVYSGLARHAFKGGLTGIGTRLLAQHLTTNQSTVSRCLQELCHCGHIVKTQPTMRGKRGGYKLVSTTFLPQESKQRRDSQRRPSVRSAARMQAEQNAEREVS